MCSLAVLLPVVATTYSFCLNDGKLSDLLKVLPQYFISHVFVFTWYFYMLILSRLCIPNFWHEMASCIRCAIKPKFHYADFATKSGTSSRQSRGRVADKHHESPRHKSRRRLS